MHQALKDNLPNTNVRGCHFHYGQCILRKVNSYDLKTIYLNKHEPLRINIRKIIALAFLREDLVKDAYEYIRDFEIKPRYIKTSTNFKENIIKLLNYIEKTWIDGRFPIKIWNHYKRKTRTLKLGMNLIHL